MIFIQYYLVIVLLAVFGGLMIAPLIACVIVRLFGIGANGSELERLLAEIEAKK